MRYLYRIGLPGVKTSSARQREGFRILVSYDWPPLGGGKAVFPVSDGLSGEGTPASRPPTEYWSPGTRRSLLKRGIGRREDGVPCFRQLFGNREDGVPSPDKASGGGKTAFPPRIGHRRPGRRRSRLRMSCRKEGKRRSLLWRGVGRSLGSSGAFAVR